MDTHAPALAILRLCASLGGGEAIWQQPGLGCSRYAVAGGDGSSDRDMHGRALAVLR